MSDIKSSTHNQPKIGIIGGGQLGKMLAEAAHGIGLSVELFDPDPSCCSSQVAKVHTGQFNDLAALQRFSEAVDLLTFEFENIPASILSLLDRNSIGQQKLFPSAAALSVSQDRLKEKELFGRLNIPTTRYRAVSSGRQLREALSELGYPAILKTRSLGYDGKGQCRILSEADLEKGDSLIYQEQLKAAAVDGANTNARVDIESQGVPCILEELINFKREFSIIAARDKDGEIFFYPLTENRHLDGILLYSVAPMVGLVQGEAVNDEALRKSFAGFAAGGGVATEDEMAGAKADDIATYQRLNSEAQQLIGELLAEFDYRGVLTLELFESEGRLLANEIAPRVHNSGHWTMDVAGGGVAGDTRGDMGGDMASKGLQPSQFLAHMACVAGISLESIGAKDSNDAKSSGIKSHPQPRWYGMLNLVSQVPELTTLNQLTIHRLHPHIYGKPERARRKLGHLNLGAGSYVEIKGYLEALVAARYPGGGW